ncbi:Berberine bridge enzyme-like 17 [Linum grandiflorum]
MGPDTAKPLAIVTPTRESHVQATVVCSKLNRLQLRTRSGGHDYEGLSYRSPSPFVLLDLNNLRSIDIDLASETAWVQSGATLGELYYSIANKSKSHAFPAGVCPTIGVGGHIVGGGYGNLLRKYGLSIDNVLDARVVDPNGNILTRSTMGDLFWAIRGGGGASFGVILSWKIKLVRVPEIVTTFDVKRKMEKCFPELGFKAADGKEMSWAESLLSWAMLPTGPLEVLLNRKAEPWNFKSKSDYVTEVIPKEALPGIWDALLKTDSAWMQWNPYVSFIGEYLGRVKDLVQLLNESFPELGFKEEDGKEMSWLDSVLFWVPFPEGTPAEALLSRKESIKRSFKSKSDYVKEVIPKEALPQIWDLLLKTGAAFTQWNPYGGRMAEIPTDRIAYPHRAGYLFKVQYFIGWTEEGEEAEAKHIAALTALHDVVTPYVTKEPREAFFNYRDLDNGENSVDYPNWEKAKVYGEKYFKGHFERLSKIKRQFDPENFFRDQQSIPPFPY